MITLTDEVYFFNLFYVTPFKYDYSKRLIKVILYKFVILTFKSVRKGPKCSVQSISLSTFWKHLQILGHGHETGLSRVNVFFDGI